MRVSRRTDPLRRRTSRTHTRQVVFGCCMTQAGAGPYLEALEARQFLSSDVPGLTPDQVRHAYGFDQLSFTQIATKRSQRGNRHRASAKTISADGSGQTIAIVD